MDEQLDNTQDASSEAVTESAQAATESVDAQSGGASTIESSQVSPQEQAASAPAEDSGEPETKKAEAAVNNDEWKNKLSNFQNKMNGVFAAKENMKLVAVEEKVHVAYATKWKQQSNRYFQLVVALRRRIHGGKVGGKSVA